MIDCVIYSKEFNAVPTANLGGSTFLVEVLRWSL
jgi:hypothetical protein